MVSRICPNCWHEVEDYFANADNWKVIQEYACTCHQWATSCGQSSKIEETTDVVQCQNCEEWLIMHAKVETPCGDNEIVLELSFVMEQPSDMYYLVKREAEIAEAKRLGGWSGEHA